MELFLTQVSSPDISQQSLGLEGFLSYPQQIPKLLSRNLFRTLKKILSNPNVSTTPLVLALFSKLLFQDSITSIFSEVLKDLLLLASNHHSYSYSLVASLISDYLSKPLDFKSLNSVFNSALSNKENKELRKTCFSILKDLENGNKITKELISIMENSITDETDEFYEESLVIIQNANEKNKKLQDLGKDNQFGWVPQQVIERINSPATWKEKLLGLQSLENILGGIESIQTLLPSILEFINFLCKVLTDSNFKISISCLKVVSALLCFKGISKHDCIFNLVPLCLLKFGDSKISVRLLTHKVIRQFLNSGLEKTIPELITALEDTNWHIREESTVCLIASMLLRPSDFNYLSLVSNISKLLDDQRTKIRLASIEALAVISSLCGERNILSKLEEIVDSEVLKEITDRFSQKHLPSLTDEYIYFPKDIPKTYRLVSSPYLGASLSPLNFPAKIFSSSASFDKIIPDTPTSADTFSSEKKNLTQKLLGSKSLRALSSTNFKLKHRSSLEIEANPNYVSYEDLNPIVFPSEALQKCIFHSENWLEQFETVNLIRRLVKHHPEVFLSKVTLHNIVLNLVKWADSLRSALSKNALIALKEMCDKLGKSADGEIADILRIFLKKNSDTNTFISETASQGLDSLCNQCSDTKLLVHLVAVAENTKNPSIKAKLMHCICKILQKSKSSVLKMRDINKALQYIHEYQTDANSEVRSSAKKAYDLLIQSIPDESYLDSVLNQGIRESAYRKIKESIKKKSKHHLEASAKIKVKKKEPSIILPYLVRSKLKKHISSSARELIVQVSAQDAIDLKKIEQVEADILNIEWKIRYEAISTAFDLIKGYLGLLISSNKLRALMIVFQKGLSDSSLKVLIHSLTYIKKVIRILPKKFEEFLSVLLDPLLVCLGSSNTSIREEALEACKAVNETCSKEGLLPLYVENIGKTCQKGRSLIIGIVNALVPGIKDLKVLENFALPFAYKLIDDIRPDVRNEASKLLRGLYKVMGNQILESAPTSKLHKIINIISKEL